MNDGGGWGTTPAGSECVDHVGRRLEYWCQKDGIAVCQDCAILGKHRGHEIKKLKEIYYRYLLQGLSLIHI